MNNIELIHTERSLEENISFSKEVFNQTRVDNHLFANNNKVLSSLIIGASLLSSVQNVEAKGIKLLTDTTENYITVTTDYNKNISKPSIKYFNDINILSKLTTTKHSIIKNILSFKSLEESWDGYKALPLEIESATNTIQLIDLVGEKTFCSINDYYPNPNGTITLEWKNNQEEIVSVEVGNNTFSYFVELSSEKAQFFNKKNINDKEAKKLAEYIQVL